ncbi:hypothetical protein K439DRAFT_1616399 [Ramaria rubella]|nr:hypothetical protein K439DRAFT_1616399 [Ramaria rubella]
MGRFGLPSKAKKGKAPVASRKRDTPDPTLVIEGQHTRKPTARATAGHASVDSVEMLGDGTAHQLSPHQEEVDSDYSNDIHNSGVDANTVDPDNELDEIFDGIPEAAPTVPRAPKKTSKAVKNKVLDAKKEAVFSGAEPYDWIVDGLGLESKLSRRIVINGNNVTSQLAILSRTAVSRTRIVAALACG